MSREDSSVASEVCTTLRNRSLDNIKLTTLLRHSRQAIYCGGMTMLLAAKPLRARRRMTFYGMCATGMSRPNLYGWFGRRSRKRSFVGCPVRRKPTGRSDRRLGDHYREGLVSGRRVTFHFVKIQVTVDIVGHRVDIFGIFKIFFHRRDLPHNRCNRRQFS